VSIAVTPAVMISSAVLTTGGQP